MNFIRTLCRVVFAPSKSVRIVISQGKKGKFRWHIYEGNRNKLICSCPIAGFPSHESALQSATQLLNRRVKWSVSTSKEKE